MPEGYIACPENVKTDSVKESLVQDVLARERLYLYGTPYFGKKPDFKSAYTFKDSLCQTNFKDARIFKDGNPCSIKTGFGENWPYAAKHEPKYNTYKKGACFPAKDFKFNRYVFGEKDKSGLLRIDSLLPMQKFLYNEGELVDLRMGFSIVDIHKALYPAAYSYDDAHFYDIVKFHKIGTHPVPERHRKEIEAGAKRVFDYCHLPERDYFK